MAARHVIHLPGVRHKAPIPAGVRIGNMVFSSAINGKDPATGAYPEDPAEQARLAFANLAAFMEQAGGSTDDIAHVTVFLADRAYKRHIDEEWLAMFPDPENRPARHAVASDRAGNMVIQLEIIAVLPDGGDAR